jgi:hypothetical protein
MAIPLLAASMASVVYLAEPGVPLAFADPAAATSATSDSNLTEAQQTSREKMERLQLKQKQFLDEHEDASGKLRPDLWRKGVEQQKQMKVAPYIGAKPLGSTTTSKKN